ncbi:hypothetical protein BJX65DRAFT_231365 [Aspergillus insuetus]
MDLRQRHATLPEAQATGRQGNTIMAFTVVTILFLPASFMSWFFAIPVAQFSRSADSDNMDLLYIVRWLLVFTLPVAALFIYSAFYINQVLSFVSWCVGWMAKGKTSIVRQISTTTDFQLLVRYIRLAVGHLAQLKIQRFRPKAARSILSSQSDEESLHFPGDDGSFSRP